VNLVGHSMGGGVAMQYAGVRPERVRRLVNLEGFGMPATQPDQAAERLGRWMDELKQVNLGELALRAYAESAGVARRLMKTNPRLNQDKADWLALNWAQKNEAGEWQILGEPGHKLPNPYLYRVDEVLAVYARISMPALMVEAANHKLEDWWKGRFTLAEHHERLRVVPQLRIVRIEDAGHMMHHDQPEQLASLIEDFIA
jgi:pimeloyl-ACP methyl ester carboxylesterase